LLEAVAIEPVEDAERRTAGRRPLGRSRGSHESQSHLGRRAFSAWADEQGQIPFSPAAKPRRPRTPRHAAPLLPQSADARLLSAATSARDRVALLPLLIDLGIRRSGPTGVRLRDLDIGRRQVTVVEKGQKRRVIPLRRRIVLKIEGYRRRVADLGVASQALGRADPSITAAICGHHDMSDLERAWRLSHAPDVRHAQGPID
jgi:site-specific recombinase XerC